MGCALELYYGSLSGCFDTVHQKDRQPKVEPAKQTFVGGDPGGLPEHPHGEKSICYGGKFLSKLKKLVFGPNSCITYLTAV